MAPGEAAWLALESDVEEEDGVFTVGVFHLKLNFAR
jgi:hypothetical protein